MATHHDAVAFDQSDDLSPCQAASISDGMINSTKMTHLHKKAIWLVLWLGCRFPVNRNRHRKRRSPLRLASPERSSCRSFPSRKKCDRERTEGLCYCCLFDGFEPVLRFKSPRAEHGLFNSETNINIITVMIRLIIANAGMCGLTRKLILLLVLLLLLGFYKFLQRSICLLPVPT